MKRLYILTIAFKPFIKSNLGNEYVKLWHLLWQASLGSHTQFASCLFRGGGGRYLHNMHIGYVPRERPPFSALNFRSGAYHFHKLPKKSVSAHHHFKIFLADFAVPETIIFKISLISTHSSPPTAGSARSQSVRQRRWLAAGQIASWQFRRLAFSRSKRIKRVPEPRIFKLKTAEARSGAPHFHAQPGARCGARAHFSLCRGTLPKFGVSTPPPPPPRAVRILMTSK